MRRPTLVRASSLGVQSILTIMRRSSIAQVMAVLAMLLAAGPAAAQRHKPPVKKTPAKTAAMKTVTPDVKCPSLIGMGVKTVRSFCDVLAGRDPSEGIV